MPSMRAITDHVVEGDAAPQLTITVLDEPGAGGANHYYSISGTDISKNPSADPEWFPLETNIFFQNGPIKEAGVNGVTQEALLAIVIDRLRHFQAGPYPSTWNLMALNHCQTALLALQERTKERIVRGVEGRTEK